MVGIMIERFGKILTAAPNFCTFCNASEMPDPTFPVSLYGEVGTCQQFGEVSTYISSLSVCETDFANLAQGCCLSPGRPCSVCPDKSMVGDPSKPLIVEPLTCLDLDILAGFATADQCPKAHSENLDFAAFCGCKGTTAPDQCSFCPDGMVVTDPALRLPNQVGLTCGQAADFARYIVNATFCAEQVAPVGEKFCCHNATNASNSSASVASPQISKNHSSAMSILPNRSIMIPTILSLYLLVLYR